ncbi:MAG: PorT family protein [Muribaculaceae bacterium]|nr:PorT family protein [Muribaculaceae bacterium]
MKKIFTLAICAIVALSGMAQMYGGRPRTRVVVRQPGLNFRGNPHDYYSWHNTYYGLRLGLNAGSVRSDAPALDGSSLKTGLNIGVAVGTQLSRYTPIFLESGLYFSQKGGKSNNIAENGGKFTYDLGYMELPILLKYKHFTRTGLSIEPFAGPFLACGISGDIKDYGERQAFSSYSNGYFNRFDAGIKLGCGVSYGIGYAEVAYDIGLANVGQDTFDDTHTGCLTINIGVNF